MPRELHTFVEDADDFDACTIDSGEQDHVTTAPAASRDVQGAQIAAEFGAVLRPRRVRAVIEIAQGREDYRPVAACLLNAEMLGGPNHDAKDIPLGRRG